LPFSHRSTFAIFRCGVAPLIIETGRFENLRIEERICCFWSDFIEDETHVLLNCPFYYDFRGNLFTVAKGYTVDFMSFNNEEKIMFLFSNENNNEEKIMFLFSNENMIRICARTCLQILKRRRHSLYCK
jgi:hypothetical protein